jgi:hypothetical protein
MKIYFCQIFSFFKDFVFIAFIVQLVVNAVVGSRSIFVAFLVVHHSCNCSKWLHYLLALVGIRQHTNVDR